MTTYILNSTSTQFLNEIYNYYNTELREAYQGYYFNLYKGNQIIAIETDCPYIYNSDGYYSEANEYQTTITETWLEIGDGHPETKTYVQNY